MNSLDHYRNPPGGGMLIVKGCCLSERWPGDGTRTGKDLVKGIKGLACQAGRRVAAALMN